MTDFNYKPLDGREIDLSRYVPGFESEIAGQWGKHRIPGQRGVLQEDLGEGALTTVVELQFAGATLVEYAAVMNDMNRRRRGLLFHPRRGARQVVITRFRERVKYTDSGEATLVQVFFEDAVVVVVDQFKNGPSAAAQQVTAQALFVEQAVATYRARVFQARDLLRRKLVTAAEIATLASTAAAQTYSTQAQEAFTFGLYDPAVRAQLNGLPPLVQVAQTALRASGRPFEIQDPVTGLEVMLYAARQLDAAIRANQPIPVETEVTRSPGQGIYAFVQQHYGRSGKTPDELRNLADLILRINPKVRRPSMIPVGTWLIRPV